tara:strand:+ start:553 stop:888 length:336 start_codon:yes stop_codon:yes gene_type:complete
MYNVREYLTNTEVRRLIKDDYSSLRGPVGSARATLKSEASRLAFFMRAHGLQTTDMDRQQRIDQIAGCYITIPTMFRDPDLEVDLDATRQVVQFLIDGGCHTGNGVILGGG